MSRDTFVDMAEEFKPNIYPIMYWALIFGLSATVVLFLLSVLSRYITLLWFPIFLAGLVWGGYRNYQRQRREWERTHNISGGAGSPLQEFKEATRDVVAASRELIAQQPQQEEQAFPEADERVPAPPSPSRDVPPARQGSASGGTVPPAAPPPPQ